MTEKNEYIMDYYEERLMVSALNYSKSIVFLFLAEKHLKEKDLVSSVIESYYSIFHLSLSRINLFKGYIFDLSAELCNPDDPNRKKLSHKKIQKLIEEIVKQSLLPKSFLELLKDLEGGRVYVNYGPRLSRDENEYIFDTCSYPSLMEDAPKYIQLIKHAFNDYINSLQKIDKFTYHLIDAYHNNIFNKFYPEINFCSDEVLNRVREFRSELFIQYLREFHPDEYNAYIRRNKKIN